MPPWPAGTCGLRDERQTAKTGLRGVFHSSSSTTLCCFSLSFKWDVREQTTGGGYASGECLQWKSSRIICPRLPRSSSSSSASWFQADVTHWPHCERNSVCFPRESSPLGRQGFPGRQVGFPQMCVCGSLWVCACVRACALGIFFIHAGLRKQWSGWGSAVHLRRHLYGSSVWPLERVSRTHFVSVPTSCPYTLKHTCKYTNGHVHTQIYLLTTIQTHTYTHAAWPQTIYHITAPQISSESLQRTETYLIWASMVEGLSVTSRKERFLL